MNKITLSQSEAATAYAAVTQRIGTATELAEKYAKGSCSADSDEYRLYKSEIRRLEKVREKLGAIL